MQCCWYLQDQTPVSKTWKLEALNLLVPKAVKLPTQEKKYQMGIRRKSQFSWWSQSVEDNCEAYSSSLLWGLDTCSKQVSMSQMLVWIDKEHFYRKCLCLTRSLNSLKVLGWINRLLILCSNIHLSPPKKISPKESEIQCRSRQLMAFMTQIEICIWNHKIMHKQEPQSEKYRENCLGKQETKQQSWRYFSFYMNWRQQWNIVRGGNSLQGIELFSPASSIPFLNQHLFHASQNIISMFSSHPKGKKTQQASIVTEESIKWDNIWASQQATLGTAANT